MEPTFNEVIKSIQHQVDFNRECANDQNVTDTLSAAVATSMYKEAEILSNCIKHLKNRFKKEG